MTLIDYVKLGNITKIQELIAQGVDLNVQDEYGYTALIWAVSHSKYDISKLLLNAGADKDITDRWGCNALYWANFYTDKKVTTPKACEEIISLLNNKPVLTKKKKGK